MRKATESLIILFSELVMFSLALVWYLDSGEIEALIVMIGLGISIILTAWIRSRKSDDKNAPNRSIIKVKGKGNIVIQENRGNVDVTKSK